MGERVKVLQKGKITIPAEIRQRLGIGEGDYVELQISDNKLFVLPPNTVANPTEVLSGLAEGIQLTEPLKQELKKARAAKVIRKISRGTC
jgi:AbrB family looped-hinge helix DNA binding protein